MTKEEKMKRTFYTVMVFICLAFFISSCDGPSGPNGEDGNAYASVVSSDGTLDFSTGFFASFPSIFYYGDFYLTDPGTYDFSFTTSYFDVYGDYHSLNWYGTYSISINYGDHGGRGKPFWQRGDPGSDAPDRYYRLDCTFSDGLDAYYGNSLSKPAAPHADTLVEGKIYMKNFSDGRYTIHIESQIRNRSIKKTK